MATAVISQGTTVMGMLLVAVVGFALALIVAIKLLVVFQSAATTEALLTLVATTIILGTAS
jgi:hypothetical protein